MFFHFSLLFYACLTKNTPKRIDGLYLSKNDIGVIATIPKIRSKKTRLIDDEIIVNGTIEMRCQMGRALLTASENIPIDKAEKSPVRINHFPMSPKEIALEAWKDMDWWKSKQYASQHRKNGPTRPVFSIKAKNNVLDIDPTITANGKVLKSSFGKCGTSLKWTGEAKPVDLEIPMLLQINHKDRFVDKRQFLYSMPSTLPKIHGFAMIIRHSTLAKGFVFEQWSDFIESEELKSLFLKLYTINAQAGVSANLFSKYWTIDKFDGFIDVPFCEKFGKGRKHPSQWPIQSQSSPYEHLKSLNSESIDSLQYVFKAKTIADFGYAKQPFCNAQVKSLVRLGIHSGQFKKTLQTKLNEVYVNQICHSSAFKLQWDSALNKPVERLISTIDYIRVCGALNVEENPALGLNMLDNWREALSAWSQLTETVPPKLKYRRKRGLKPDLLDYWVLYNEMALSLTYSLQSLSVEHQGRLIDLFFNSAFNNAISSKRYGLNHLTVAIETLSNKAISWDSDSSNRYREKINLLALQIIKNDTHNSFVDTAKWINRHRLFFDPYGVAKDIYFYDVANQMIFERGSRYINQLYGSGNKAQALSEANRLNRQLYWVFSKRWLRQTARRIKNR